MATPTRCPTARPDGPRVLPGPPVVADRRGRGGRRGLAAVTAALLLGIAACGSTTDDDAGGDERPAEPRGVTDDEITIGIEYVEADDAAFEASGIEGVTTGNMRAVYEMLVEQINEDGGVLGRQIRAVYHGVSPDSTDVAADEQALCTAFTQDAEVFAAVITRHLDPVLSCLDEAGVVAIGPGGINAADSGVFERYPHYLEAGSLSLDLMAGVLVETLLDEGFLTEDSTVGAILVDDPAFVRALEEGMVPALEDAGLELAHEVRISIESPDAVSAAVQSSVLGFREAGVDRILLLDSGGGLMLYLTTAADAQGYRPRYAMTTQSGGTAVVPNLPAEQLEGSMGIGWSPDTDVPASEVESWPARDECLERLAPGGEFADENARGLALDGCSELDLLVAALEAGGEPTARAFMEGLESLGDDFEMASTPATRYGPDRHDGIGAVRTMAFDTACTCFRYQGEPRPVG